MKHSQKKASQPLIELKDVHKSYWNGDLETVVLKGINLKIENGEFVAIMGPSGSGKSTLMHILGFLDQITKGKYLFRGEDVSSKDEDELSEIRAIRVSFVFQAFNLLPRTTVEQNVMLPLLYHPSIPEKERIPRVKKAIERVGLQDRSKYLTNQLSGGQQQRVAIARSLVTEPDVIFADEPTGNLDSRSGIAVMKTLQELHSQGHNIILVTHESTTAQHAERIIRIHDGLIEQDTKDFKRIFAKEKDTLK